MRRTCSLLVGLGLALGACGEDEESAGPEQRATEPTTEQASKPRPRPGTRIELGDSEFGTMLFGPNRQAIYVFQNDAKNKTVCYGECAAAWPPVYTKGEPRAGKGVRQSLLGTVRRRDGRVQVTYAGRPLYYYVNEGPGEVRCHNVHLNGGLWWVVGPDGKRRA